MRLEEILTRVREGELSVDAAVAEIRGFEDIGFGKVDYAREARTGFPEVIFGQGKTAEQVREIFHRLFQKHRRVMVTRADQEMVEQVRQVVPEA